MPQYSFEDIKALLQKSISLGFEAELSITFSDRPGEYMIIIYDDFCSFIKCGTEGESALQNYPSLDELYKAVQPDGIVLERDWEKITELYCPDFDILNLW
ncbi:MAG: hypothetical protein K2K57_05810 [Oscillospiraceae bacterium]|nr:hypothetical protein [Oscillospiraceae bacterium]